MATMETSKKVHFVGKWHEDTFSDEILKNIAAHALAEKGKKVKIVMNQEGIRFIRQRVFKDDFVEFHPLKNIKTVTKNTRCDYCVMFILADSVKKYQIIAIRCDSEPDAIYITNFFNQFRHNNAYRNAELRKRTDTGNWTLRDRSAHNASLHLKEVFKEQQLQRQKSLEDHNGNVIAPGSPTIPTASQNGILKQTSIESESAFPYTDVHPETTTGDWRSGQITAFSKGGESKDDTKALLEHSQIAERVAHNSDTRRGMTLLANKPKIHGGAIYTSGTQTLGSRHTSGDLALFKRYQPQPVRGTPGRNSLVINFNSGAMMNGYVGKPRSNSLRIPSSQKLSTSSTIHRSIEETYAKPVIIQHRGDASGAKPIIVQQRVRRGSGNSIILARHQRPTTVHVMGENSLHVLRDGSEMF